ncbi:hypothetical protein ACOMHN_036753 [Nucella lapillus]
MAEHEKFKVPDWKTYKVDGIPNLEKTQRLLAARQLKDPWIRNEVWRFSKENYGGQYRNAAVSLGRGLKWALLAVGLTISLDVLGFLGTPSGHHQSSAKNEEEDEWW